MNTRTSQIDTNRLLAALSPAEWQRLEPDLVGEHLAAGTVLHRAGAALHQVYFPVTTAVSLVCSLEDGGSAEVAVVGNEGLVEVCAFMGDAAAMSDALVTCSGHAWRMDRQAILHHHRRSPLFMQLLLGYAQALFSHMAQSTACNRHHGIDQQLCRWLLQHLDRQRGNAMQITQERIAGLLGVRREGVTVGALKLQKAGLIRYHRGHLSVIDRHGLEERSCECYDVIRRAYNRLPCQRPAPLKTASLGWSGSGG